MMTDEYLMVEYSDHHFCDLHHTPPAPVSLTMFATEQSTVTQMDKMTRTILPDRYKWVSCLLLYFPFPFVLERASSPEKAK